MQTSVLSPPGIKRYALGSRRGLSEATWKKYVEENFPESVSNKPSDLTWSRYYEILYQFSRKYLYFAVNLYSMGTYRDVLLNNRDLIVRSPYPFEISLDYPPLLDDSGTSYLPIVRLEAGATEKQFYDYINFWVEERNFILNKLFSPQSNERNFAISTNKGEEEFVQRFGYNPRYLILDEEITQSNVSIYPPEGTEAYLLTTSYSPVGMEAYIPSPYRSPAKTEAYVSPPKQRRSRRLISPEEEEDIYGQFSVSSPERKQSHSRSPYSSSLSSVESSSLKI